MSKRQISNSNHLASVIAELIAEAQNSTTAENDCAIVEALANLDITALLNK